MDTFEMDEIHKEVLAQNRTYLLKNITLNELFYSELLVKKIFTDEMLDDIQVLGLLIHLNNNMICF